MREFLRSLVLRLRTSGERVISWENSVEPYWKHWSVGLGLWMPFVFLLMWFHFFPPSPGMSAITCGCFVALIVLRDMNSFQKVLCVLMVTAFMVIELRSISRDQANQSKDRIEAEKNLNEDFAKVLRQNQEDFDNTFSQFDRVLKNITGGDSFPYVMPESEGALFLNGIPRKDTIPLVIFDEGDYPLTGISITIARESDPIGDVRARYFEPDCTVPEVTPHQKVPLKQQICPDYKAHKTLTYLVWIRAQNGVYMEELMLRKGAGIFDAYKINVFKQELDGDKATITSLRQDYKWSDER